MHHHKRSPAFESLSWKRHRPAPPPHLPVSIMPWEVGRGSGPVPPVSVEPKQTLKTDRRGAVIGEMALVLPPLVTLLPGLVRYGPVFLISHSLQHTANHAAPRHHRRLRAPATGT